MLAERKEGFSQVISYCGVIDTSKATISVFMDEICLCCRTKNMATFQSYVLISCFRRNVYNRSCNAKHIPVMERI